MLIESAMTLVVTLMLTTVSCGHQEPSSDFNSDSFKQLEPRYDYYDDDMASDHVDPAASGTSSVPSYSSIVNSYENPSISHSGHNNRNINYGNRGHDVDSMDYDTEDTDGHSNRRTQSSQTSPGIRTRGSFRPPSVMHVTETSDETSAVDEAPVVVSVPKLFDASKTGNNRINFISASTELEKSRWWFYEGSLSFSAKGMDHLYLIQEFLMSLIQPPGLPEEMLNDQLFTDPIPLMKDHRARILSHFWGMILTATIGLCLVIIVPLFGFMICCCLCNDPKNGKKNKKNATRAKSRDSYGHQAASSSSPRNKKSAKNKRNKYSVETSCDSCFRSVFGMIHFILLLLITFFVISAFVTNEYIRNGFSTIPVTFNQSLDDMGLYLNNTQFEVNTLLRTNYGQLEFELSDSLDKSGLIIKNRLALVSEAIALDNLTEIVSKLDDIQADLRVLSQETNELRNSLHLLSTGLHRAKKDLEKVFKECTHPVCTALRSKYRFVLEKFKVSTKLDDLPDLSPLMANITALLQSDIIHEVQRGKDAFDRISIKIQAAVNESIPEIKRQIRAVGHELSITSNDINDGLKIPFKDIKRAKESIITASEFTSEYEDYRWYACLSGAGVILVILACYTFGLLMGVCGNRPSVNDYRSRRIKPPSTWLLKLGIFLVFVFFGILLLANIGLFFIGGLADRIGCYYLDHPNDDSTKHLISLIQKQIESGSWSSAPADGSMTTDASISRMIISKSKEINQHNPGVKPNIADVLSRCHLNSSLFQALQLNKFNRIQLTNSKVIEDFNVSSILNIKAKYGIEDRLEQFLSKVDVTPGPIIILTREGNDLLEKLKETSLGTLNFSSFADLVNQVSIWPLFEPDPNDAMIDIDNCILCWTLFLTTIITIIMIIVAHV